LAGLTQVLRAQASNQLGQAEALVGLTDSDDFLQAAIKDCKAIEENDSFAVD
jgi:hypothetical protein